MAFKNLLPASGAVRSFLALITLAVAGLVFSSPAAAETTRVTFGFGATITECGNTIEVSGTGVVTFHVTETPSGGFLFTGHFLLRQMRGSDEFGRRYIANGLTRNTVIGTPAGGSIETFINRFHIVGTRGAPTFYVKETFHITVTPAGKLAADVERFSVTCR